MSVDCGQALCLLPHWGHALCLLTGDTLYVATLDKLCVC